MRVWDISPCILCKKHLIAEHHEIHTIYNVIVHNKKGYSNHPETKRWIGKLKALYDRHNYIVAEMKIRGYNHNSVLDHNYATGIEKQDEYINSKLEQIHILQSKKCDCMK